MTTTGVPGLRGCDHIGITVPNLAEAVRFFVEVIGCTPFYEVGPIASDGDFMQTQLNVHPRAVAKVRFLRMGHGPNIELFEYAAPDQKTQMPRNSDVGASHLGVYVDDFEAALTYLRAHGVQILGEPVVRHSGPNAGRTWVYFLTPWGMQMELVSYPAGMAYEREYEERLWHPGRPAQ